MSLISSLLSFRCMICCRRIKYYGLCKWCNPKQYKAEDKNYCQTCLLEISSNHNYCNRCLLSPPPYKNIEYLWEYDVQSRNILKQIKYYNNEALLRLITKIFILKITPKYLINNFDLIIPMPESHKTSKTRNYNLCLYLARKLAKELKIKTCNQIRKKKNIKPQAVLNTKERIKNVENAFYLKKNNVKNKHILVLEDVITTGASIIEVSKLCQKYQVKSMSFIALARSPNWHQQRHKLES